MAVCDREKDGWHTFLLCKAADLVDVLPAGSNLGERCAGEGRIGDRRGEADLWCKLGWIDGSGSVLCDGYCIVAWLSTYCTVFTVVCYTAEQSTVCT
jgi:hypothetical protein